MNNLDELMKKYDIHFCTIPVDRTECEDARRKCSECPFKDNCGCYWISELWQAENKKFKQDTLLGPFNPAFVKPDFRAMHVITVGNDHDNFCCFNNPRSKDYVVVGDIYVDESARGKGVSKKIINFLMEYADKDLFAKCVSGTSAESFWSHIGVQVNRDHLPEPGWHEVREGKRDLSWYRVKNTNKSAETEELW